MITNTCDFEIFDFGVSRALIKKLGVEAKNQIEAIALSILSDNPLALEERKKSHLTHSVSKENQIRFALSSRIECGLRPLAKRFAQVLEPGQTIAIPHLKYLMPGDRFFINLVLQYLPANSFHYIHDPKSSTNIDLLGPSEKEILQLIKQVPHCTTALGRVLVLANALLYSGNYWTAKNALEFLHLHDPDHPEVNYSLGIVSNFFGEPEKAEYHFEKARMSKDILVKIKAHYTLSMLYSRHHSSNRINLGISASYLEEAREIISCSRDLKDRDFQYVFNRNGYALILFRQGKIDKAIHWLKFGIQKLIDLNDEAAHLHISVLQYNLCQCYQAMGQLKMAHEAFRQLVEIDPLFAEYRIDWGILYCQSQSWKKAYHQFKRAKDLNPFIGEVYQNLAFVQLEMGDSCGAQNTIEEGLRNLPLDDGLYSQWLWLSEQTERGA